jgi:nucleoside-diphosphate-sugar epimerase
VKPSRVLVTGATGFTGGHLCERLVKEGQSVRALVRDPCRASKLKQLDVELALGDLRNSASVERAMAGTDLVYHIGAEFRHENLSRKEMREVNVDGTRNMLDAAVKAGVQRFIHCSTVGVHGDVKDPPANENAPYAPGDVYQHSKTDAERLVLQYGDQAQLPIVIFRPGGIYGPGDLRFLKLFKAIKKRRFIMLGSGQVLYQVVYIDDLIDGILLCGSKEDAVGKTYILTGNEPATLNQLVKMIAEAVGVRGSRLRFPVMPVYLAGAACELICKPFGINPPLYRRRVDFFRKTRSFDISKAKSELGFEPRVDLCSGIKRTAAWYRQEGLLS